MLQKASVYSRGDGACWSKSSNVNRHNVKSVLVTNHIKKYRADMWLINSQIQQILTYKNFTLHFLKAKRLRISVNDRLVADVTCLQSQYTTQLCIYNSK